MAEVACDLSYNHDPLGNRLEAWEYTRVKTPAVIRRKLTACCNGLIGWTRNIRDDENRRVKVVLPTGTVNTSVYNGEGFAGGGAGLARHAEDRLGRQGVLAGDRWQRREQGAVHTQEPSEFGRLITQWRDVP
jgi:hypothetical protein